MENNVLLRHTKAAGNTRNIKGVLQTEQCQMETKVCPGRGTGRVPACDQSNSHEEDGSRVANSQGSTQLRLVQTRSQFSKKSFL